MAVKGAKGGLEAVARQLYADGMSQTQIAKELDVSDATVGRWKKDSWLPGENTDEWEKARKTKRSTVERLAVLFDRELKAAEDAAAGTVGPATFDALQKLGGMVRRWQEIEREDSSASSIDRPKVFLEDLQFIAEHLKNTDPEGLKVLARNFDPLVMAFKAKYA
jgi:transcriptional regulator with XRE-family HTH domain